jgi:hypothetical protein
MMMVGKILISAILIGLINSVARTNPRLGGIIAGAPVVSLISILWLIADGAPGAAISRFVAGVLLALVPTAAYLAALAGGLRLGFPLAASLAFSLGLWLVLAAAGRLAGV